MKDLLDAASANPWLALIPLGVLAVGIGSLVVAVLNGSISKDAFRLAKRQEERRNAILDIRRCPPRVQSMAAFGHTSTT